MAILAGLLLAISFPTPGIAGFAWIAPGLLLTLGLGRSGRNRFGLGYAAGVVHYLVSLRWLLNIPVTGFPILGWLALGFFLALYPACWLWMVWRFVPKTSAPEPAGGLLSGARQVAAWGWARRFSWCLACAAAWVALEAVISRLFSGFAWNLLGASQSRIVPLIQLASVTGIAGLSFLIVWSSASLFCAGCVIIGKPGLRSVWMGEIALPLATVMTLFIAGFHRVAALPDPARELRVTLVQPSVPQTLIWDASRSDERFEELVRLTELALTNRTDLLIWPEAAVPRPLRYDAATYRAITGLAKDHQVWMIVGSDDVEPRLADRDPNAADFFNASFLVGPDGKIAGNYRKRHLVIFGEYIPLLRWLPFVKWLTPITGQFTAGDRPVPFDLPDLDVRTSVLICFEDVFAEDARAAVDAATDFLVNLTNDGWFGEGAAQWQQAGTAAFRAVENGLPLVRCTNNGLTCWFDACGRLRDAFHDSRGGIYGAGFTTVRIPLPAPGTVRKPTFFHRHGDWFAWLCVVIAAWHLMPRSRRLP
ncbi:MAG: apolipoprotein N-acyltransferase [Verrucomicrobiota bacterium]